MATKLLQEVFERAAELPDATQDAIAARIQHEMEEARFDTLLESPASLRLLEILAAEALAEDRAGLTESGGFDGR